MYCINRVQRFQHLNMMNLKSTKKYFFVILHRQYHLIDIRSRKLFLLEAFSLEWVIPQISFNRFTFRQMLCSLVITSLHFHRPVHHHDHHFLQLAVLLSHTLSCAGQVSKMSLHEAWLKCFKYFVMSGDNLSQSIAYAVTTTVNAFPKKELQLKVNNISPYSFESLWAKTDVTKQMLFLLTILVMLKNISKV